MYRSLLALLLVVAPLAGPSLAAEKDKAAKVLFLGIDGTRFDALTASKTPHLDKLIRGGAWADNCLILGPRYRKNDTVSGPGWSSILTGVWADKHGVQDNSFKGRALDAYPHLFARIKARRPQARTLSLVSWQPIDQYIVSAADVHDAINDGSKDYAAFDAEVAQRAAKALAKEDLDCAFVYFGQIDETGHQHGFHPTVAKYRTAIETVDGHIGRLLAAIEARATRDKEDWLVVVTSDHGGQGTGHGGGHNVPAILNSLLIVSGPAAVPGKIADQTYLVDAPATVLAHLGIEIDPAWKLDGTPRGLKN